MRKETREVVADWLLVAGALLLLGSLFLTWSHQVPPQLVSVFGKSGALAGVPGNPTAWQVYSAADVALAVLAAVLVGVAVAGSRTVRLAALAATGVAVAFVLHARSSPPTNGIRELLDPTRHVPTLVTVTPAAGMGETVALAGLAIAVAGLLVSFTAD